MFDLSFLPQPLDGLIVVPPVSDVRIPSLAAHLLQACAAREGFAVSVLYGNMLFVRAAGLESNDVLCTLHPQLFGERLFSSAAYGLPPFGRDKGGVRDDYELVNAGPPELRLSFGRIKQLEPLAAAWVEELAAGIAALDCRLVGFTSSQQQTSASIAVSRAIKQCRPDMCTAIGGANCEDVMARGVAALSPDVDVVVSGEGEEAFVALLRGLREGQRPAGRVLAGTRYPDLDRLPLPDYSEYFEQASRFLPHLDLGSTLVPYETARGCWWGRSKPCRFCGFDTQRTPLRAKSDDVVARDLARLEGTYPTTWISMADPTIPRRRQANVLPRFTGPAPSSGILWTARVPLTLDDALRLREAGVMSLFIGIESFSTSLLARMGKGTTAADNVAALRHCRIAQIAVSYNLLKGVPGDEIGEYREMLPLLPQLRHLAPPNGISVVRIPRFSAYFETPDKYRISNLRPIPAYESAFPETADSQHLAYWWQGNFPSEALERPDDLAALAFAVGEWRRAWCEAEGGVCPQLSVRPCPGTLGRVGDGLFLLTDTRGLGGSESRLLNRAQARAALTDLEPRDGAVRFALDHALAVELEGRYLPLATAASSLIAELSS